MKVFLRIVSLFLVHLLLLTLFGCGGAPEETTVTTEPVQTTEAALDPVLAQRRDAAEAYMRDMATYLWRATEDFSYTLRYNGDSYEELLAQYAGKTIDIKAGRLYRGIPYSYAGAPADAFKDYATEVGEDGIPEVTGITWKHLNAGTSAGSRIGNDCSGAVQLAWDFVGGTFTPISTKNMTFNYGYLPVGEYENDPEENIITKDVCLSNGTEVMFAAYAKMQKADAVVKRGESSGHTMMVTDVVVVYKEDGSIDPMASYATFLHQTNGYIEDEKYTYDETLGENVYMTFGIDDKETFLDLFGAGYLPITCDALVDPAAEKEVWVKDSLTEHTIDNLFEGTFSSNRLLGTVTIVVTDDSGTEVGRLSVTNPRKTGDAVCTLDMSLFQTEEEIMILGDLDLEALPAGNYKCTVILRDAHGENHTMRTFDFTA